MPTERVRGMSHAMRTPLGVFLMSVDFLQSQPQSGVSPDLLHFIDEAVTRLVERLKLWSLRAAQHENEPTLEFEEWVRNEVATLGVESRELLSKCGDLEDKIPPVRSAKASLLNLLATFERIYGVANAEADLLDPSEFGEQLKLGILHSRRRLVLPMVTVSLVGSDRLFTSQRWRDVLNWTLEVEQAQPAAPIWQVVVDAATGASLHLGLQTHKLTWR